MFTPEGNSLVRVELTHVSKLAAMLRGPAASREEQLHKLQSLRLPGLSGLLKCSHLLDMANMTGLCVTTTDGWMNAQGKETTPDGCAQSKILRSAKGLQKTYKHLFKGSMASKCEDGWRKGVAPAVWTEGKIKKLAAARRVSMVQQVRHHSIVPSVRRKTYEE